MVRKLQYCLILFVLCGFTKGYSQLHTDSLPLVYQAFFKTANMHMEFNSDSTYYISFEYDHKKEVLNYYDSGTYQVRGLELLLHSAKKNKTPEDNYFEGDRLAVEISTDEPGLVILYFTATGNVALPKGKKGKIRNLDFR